MQLIKGGAQVHSTNADGSLFGKSSPGEEPADRTPEKMARSTHWVEVTESGLLLRNLN